MIMSKNNSTRNWNKVKHNPLCTLECDNELTKGESLNTNSFSGNCRYICTRVPKLIYNLNIYDRWSEARSPTLGDPWSAPSG